METIHHAEANRKIYDKLSEVVIGHDVAKKVLINLINRSKLRYYQKWGMLDRDDEDLVHLSNCLLVGDSGTGKTHLVESLSNIMKFPLLKIDATDLNPTGASGGIKSEDFVKKLKSKAQEYMEADPGHYWSLDGTLDQMIVFVDEVDKLGQRLSSDWNQHVQANFLTLFENKSGLGGVSFIFAGAFTGMNKKEEKKKDLGFTAATPDPKKPGDLSRKIIDYGLIPEFVGRLNNIVLLDILEKNDYKEILLKTILPKAAKTLACYGIDNFYLTNKEIEELTEEAHSSGLGVRALASAVDKILVDLEFDPTKYQSKNIEKL